MLVSGFHGSVIGTISRFQIIIWLVISFIIVFFITSNVWLNLTLGYNRGEGETAYMDIYAAGLKYLNNNWIYYHEGDSF